MKTLKSPIWKALIEAITFLFRQDIETIRAEREQLEAWSFWIPFIW